MRITDSATRTPKARRAGDTRGLGFGCRPSGFFRITDFALRVSLCAGLLLVTPCSTQGRINLVTLPARDSVQLTIYNSVDLTLVRETRTLTLRRGLNRLEFSWANTLIDPTSVEFRALTRADAVEVLDVSFPPRVANTLEWRLRSEVAGEVQVEIRYFTSGIRWSADYVAEAARDEQSMALAGFVRVHNGSGEDYESARVRLIVGVVRLVEQIAALARQSERRAGDKQPMTELLRDRKQERTDLYFAFDAAASEADRLLSQSAGRREVIKEAMSEYFLYTVEGRDTIPNGWAKRLPSFTAADVPVTSYYKFEQERWADQVIRFYRFTNAAPSRLGKEPLPDGAVKAFRAVTEDRLYAFLGRTQVKYIPVSETVELELGPDQEVRVKPTLMHWVKTDLAFDTHGDVKGWTTKETWEIEAQNSRDIGVVLDIRRNFAGDWAMTTEATYEKLDATKVKFVVPLQPREKRTFRYELTVRHGTNAAR